MGRMDTRTRRGPNTPLGALVLPFVSLLHDNTLAHFAHPQRPEGQFCQQCCAPGPPSISACTQVLQKRLSVCLGRAAHLSISHEPFDSGVSCQEHVRRKTFAPKITVSFRIPWKQAAVTQVLLFGGVKIPCTAHGFPLDLRFHSAVCATSDIVQLL